MLTFEQALNRLEPEFNKIYFDQSPRCLFEPIEYILALGGKRIRPCLTLMACSIYKENVEEAIDPAIGLEVFHNFTLLHDDLMDQADKRRNQPTVHKKWNTNTAILSGDAMLIAAYRFIGKTAEPHLKKILDLFSKTALEICCGQQYDMDFEKRDDVSEAEYIEMIRLKTAVLIACCIKTGAIIGGASEKDAEHLYRFGIYTGLAFQIRDDLLDVYGDTKTFGKNIGGDILCDKKTFLLINAMALADDKQKTQWAYFRNPANNYTPEEKINAYTRIYDQLHIKDLTLQKMNGLYELAVRELTNLDAPPDSLAELKKTGNLLIQRES
jgi:geranylgeranyl diphosphate synthase type II